jgi:glycosyltransferase involved in cell wall biosynthesis
MLGGGVIGSQPVTSTVRTVLYVQHYPDGGSITGLLDLVRSLDRTCVRPVVAFTTPNAFIGEFEDLGVPVHVLPGLGSPTTAPSGTPASRPPRRRSSFRRVVSRLVTRDWPAARALRSIVKEEHVDLIHANNDVLSNHNAVLASMLTRTPLVVHVRWLHSYRHDASWLLDVVLARRARRMIFMAEGIARSCRPLHVPARRQLVLDDPFDVTDYLADGDDDLRHELLLDPAQRVILHVGRLARWKGQEVLIDAMTKVLDASPDAIALLVGSSTDPDGAAYEQDLKRQVARLDLTDRVIFVGARRDVPSFLKLADVVVHSSTTPEPFGRVVVEAMAAGRPIVAADEGGVPEIIDAGRTGVLVKPRDPACLADALIAVLDDPEGAAAMGLRAQDEVRSRFSLERHGAALLGIYDLILDGSS